MNGESRRQNKTAGHHMRLLPQAKHQKYPNHEVNVAGPIDLFQRFKKKKDKKQIVSLKCLLFGQMRS